MNESKRCEVGFLQWMGSAHSSLIFQRRAEVLAQALSDIIPAGSSVLDVGCGNGLISHLIQKRHGQLTIQGLEIMARPRCLIPCREFDGRRIPLESGSVDLCMFVDVLHHADDAEDLLREAIRVSRQFVLIKDHLSENRLDQFTLKLMDWVGNRPHGVLLPYHYRSAGQWREMFSRLGLRENKWVEQLPLYPVPFNLLFGRRLHFVALLEKKSGV